MTYIVLYEGPGSQGLNADERMSLMSACLESGVRVELSSDTELDTQDDAVCVIGYLDQDAAYIEKNQVQLFNLHELEQAEIIKAIQEKAAERKPWKPWFPVIDFDRCTNCMQCLTFCLFNVYGVENDKITVKHPDNCKTDCPACSRVCPEVAIMFPKYKAGPINGDVVSEENLEREKMKVDISALLGGDIYSALRTRSADSRSRFSKERDDERALKERQRCYKKLKEALDIPETVLASLPDQDMIDQRRRAISEHVRAETDKDVGGNT